ncbi:hypothetical protein Dimus_028266 [Dionaea muscipula]
MEGNVIHSHQLHDEEQQQQHMVDAAGDSTRFPQWSLQETKEFLMIRAELDRNFMETKRNKLLWEVISTKMKERGFSRSAEQCKCKWKNMVTRYKGCETMEAAAMRQQFPFYKELQAIFTGRMQRMLWAEDEGAAAASGSKKRSTSQLLSSDEEDDHDEDDDQENDPQYKPISGSSSSRKKKKAKSVNINNYSTATKSTTNNMINSLKELLEEFMRQQLQMEMQWREAWEAREEERMRKEMEWRQMMEALENERLMMEREWREREEQRRVREEARAEKRDALVNALLNQLRDI